MSTITFRCMRQTSPECLGSFEVDEDELTGGQRPEDPDEVKGGTPEAEPGLLQPDPGFLPMGVPPDERWLPNPDSTSDDEFICVNCATPEEITEVMGDSALAEDVLREDD